MQKQIEILGKKAPLKKIRGSYHSFPTTVGCESQKNEQFIHAVSIDFSDNFMMINTIDNIIEIQYDGNYKSQEECISRKFQYLDNCMKYPDKIDMNYDGTYFGYKKYLGFINSHVICYDFFNNNNKSEFVFCYDSKQAEISSLYLMGKSIFKFINRSTIRYDGTYET